MLILTRGVGQSIKIEIAPGVVITVRIMKVNSHWKNIAIGIDAPEDIPVHREEIYERILKEREDADADKILRALEKDLQENPPQRKERAG